jgi:hypothetical protein
LCANLALASLINVFVSIDYLYSHHYLDRFGRGRKKES